MVKLLSTPEAAACQWSFMALGFAVHCDGNSDVCLVLADASLNRQPEFETFSPSLIAQEMWDLDPKRCKR